MVMKHGQKMHGNTQVEQIHGLEWLWMKKWEQFIYQQDQPHSISMEVIEKEKIYLQIV